MFGELGHCGSKSFRINVVSFPSIVWLVFEASIPTCTCFPFCDLFLLLFFSFFFVLSFRNGKREERWEGRPRGRCMVNGIMFELID